MKLSKIPLNEKAVFRYNLPSNLELPPKLYKYKMQMEYLENLHPPH